MYKKLFLSVFLITGIFLIGKNIFAAGEINIDSFDLNPKTVVNNTGGTQFQMTFRATVDVAKFNARCGSDADSFYWYVYRDVTGVDLKRGSGEVAVSRTAAFLNLNFDQTISIDTTDPDLINGGTARYYGQVNCPSMVSIQIARSAGVPITFGSVTNKSYACVANNNKYACSPANLTNCSDVSACSGRPCVQIGTSLCGQDAGAAAAPKYGCNSSNQCVADVNGIYSTSNCDNKCGGSGGTTQRYSFEIPNPLKGGASDFTSLVKIIAQWIFNLAIPIAVAMIVYAGILFLTAQGEPAKVAKAKEVLKYAIIGLAIILIGSGFITLIQSILELGSGSQ
ncbi:MAG: hypothetical protein A3I26_02755 [Candidatus Yanofskybacteria bacterium RIFCSPLOWO2_02_FULL_43_10]|nr:MAG: hypothetical protein A3C69_04040 [Candidatus Yanofskybacteria bacterium RIFCSPHIGHO2_02_FULL_43_12]OGN28602.1 MAG: hypothetical protein A3I26_02755 [Candidatus Yanofskybacteria bacterium RIFCSPLOWO2_02_FULL_43_10]